MMELMVRMVRDFAGVAVTCKQVFIRCSQEKLEHEQ